MKPFLNKTALEVIRILCTFFTSTNLTGVDFGRKLLPAWQQLFSCRPQAAYYYHEQLLTTLRC
jgi:hypothetical protein